MDSNTFYILTIGHCLGETFWQRGLSFIPPKAETDEMDCYQQVKYIKLLVIGLAWVGIIGFLLKNNDTNITLPIVYLIVNSMVFNVSYIFPREATIVYGMGFAVAHMAVKNSRFTGKVTMFTISYFMYYIIQLITNIHIFEDEEGEKRARHVMAIAICAFMVAIYVDLIETVGVINVLQLLCYFGIIIYNYYLM